MVLLSQNGILRFTCMHDVRHYCFFSAWLIFLKNLLKPFTHSNRFFQYVVFNQQQGTTNDFFLNITRKMISSLSTFFLCFLLFCVIFLFRLYLLFIDSQLSTWRKVHSRSFSLVMPVVHPRLSYVCHLPAMFLSKIVLDVQSVRK